MKTPSGVEIAAGLSSGCAPSADVISIRMNITLLQTCPLVIAIGLIALGLPVCRHRWLTTAVVKSEGKVRLAGGVQEDLQAYGLTD